MVYKEGGGVYGSMGYGGFGPVILRQAPLIIRNSCEKRDKHPYFWHFLLEKWGLWVWGYGVFGLPEFGTPPPPYVSGYKPPWASRNLQAAGGALRQGGFWLSKSGGQ